MRLITLGGINNSNETQIQFHNFRHMDVLTPEQRKKNMRAIKSKQTKIEVLLAKALWAKGCRYRKNDPSVFGKPDFCFKGKKVAVFVDSEFFHGKDWDVEKYRIKSNREFWWNKIESNIERDKLVNSTLKSNGWIVLRFWGKEIKKDLNLCAELVLTKLDER